MTVGAPDQIAAQRIAAATSIGSVGALVRARAAVQPADLAIVHGLRQITYGELIERVARLASVLKARGLQRGDRIAVLSRNRPEYLEVELAAGQVGIITACLNWRLSPRELAHCVALVSPKLLIIEDDLAADLTGAIDRLSFGAAYETALQMHARCDDVEAQAEDGLVILYTSGTTGLPKGAVISHRAMIARALVFVSELGLAPDAGSSPGRRSSTWPRPITRSRHCCAAARSSLSTAFNRSHSWRRSSAFASAGWCLSPA